MKRIFGWLCAVLLFLTPALSALGEEIPAADTDERLAVFYVHASKIPEELSSAKYIIRAVRTKNTGRDIKITRTKGSDVYNTTDNGELSRLTDYNTGLIDLKKDIIIENEELLAELAGTTSDIWMVVPNGAEGACEKVISSQPLAEQFDRLLQDRPRSRIHLILIGDLVQEPKNGTTLAELAAKYPGQVEWIRIKSNFMVQNCGEDDTCHTGDYFLASLFGMSGDSLLLAKPVDLISGLPVVPSEQPAGTELQQAEGRRWSVTLPETGHVFILQRNMNNPAPDPILKDSNNGDRSLESYMLAPPSQNDIVYYSCAVAASLPGGEYYLSGAADDTKVYWYPDFEELNPVLNMGEGDQWIWGGQTVTLTLANTLGRPDDFEVLFEQKRDDNSPSSHTVSYDSGKSWKMTFNVSQSTNTKQIQITPSARLHMKDGNLIWEWKGDPQTRELVSTPVKVREGVQSEPLLLYFTEETGGSFSGKWAEFFDFNPEENYDPVGLKRGETVPEESIGLNQTDDGFTVDAIPGTGDGGNGSIILEYGNASRELETAWKNTKDITDSTEIRTDPETVSVGENVTITATISQETYSEWQKATAQLGTDYFPGPETLKLSGTLKTEPDESAADSPEEAPFSKNEEGSYTAEIILPVPDGITEGDYEIHYIVVNTAGEATREVKNDVVSISIHNSKPVLKTVYAETLKAETAISLGGFPNSMEPKQLFREVFGTENLFDLFEDKETAIRRIEISISPSDGLMLENGEDNLPLDAGNWEINNPELSDEPETDKESANTNTVLLTKTTRPAMPWEEENKYTVRLKAYDGAQWSEELTTEVSVYSNFYRIIMYAAAGTALLLLILIIILIVRQIRKPQFTDIKLRCYVSSDENAERGREIMTKCQPTSMAYFGKKAVSLTDLLILTRQPAFGPETTEITDDIMLLPTKHGEVNVLFGKKAMERIGRHEKRDLITQNNACRMRIDNQYIQIENVR